MIIVPTIVLIGLIIAGWIIYHIGYSAGHADGADHILNEVARRAERERKII